MFYKTIFLNLSDLAKLVKPYSSYLEVTIQDYAMEFEEALSQGTSIEMSRLREMEERLFDSYGWLNEINNYSFSKEERQLFEKIDKALVAEFKNKVP